MAGPSVAEADPLAGATIVVHDLSRSAAVRVPALGPSPSSAVTTPEAAPFAAAPPTSLVTKLSAAGRVVLLLVAGAAFGVFGVITYQGRPPAQVTLGALVAAPQVEIRVQVEGAVLQPGVYRLSQGDRVEEAIKAAGGLAPNADETKLNLAQRVRDEQRLDVPALPPQRTNVVEPQGPATGLEQPEPAAAPAPAAPTQAAPTTAPSQPAAARPTSTPRPQPTARPTAFAGGRVNVNTATQAQLEQLPGLGATSAQRILAFRAANGPLRSLDDVRKAGVQEQFVRQAAEFLAFD
ncbi:MAG TPA: helix-hairpin-helix domain-containing protein [Chloroflexota bacterium]|nr:helix-hairpin-helix domain-containing protein [Chloroflexota bacterium]